MSTKLSTFEIHSNDLLQLKDNVMAINLVKRTFHYIGILLRIFIVLIVFMPIIIYAWPAFTLYGYAPLIFKFASAPSSLQSLGTTSIVKFECSKTWITGYYASDSDWNTIKVFYQQHGFSLQPGNDYLLRDHQSVVQTVDLIHDMSDMGLVHDTVLRDTVTAALQTNKTIFSYNLTYTENEYVFQQSHCRGD